MKKTEVLQAKREAKALKLLEKGDVSFLKAAEIAKLDVWTFADKVKKSKIIWVKIKPEELEKELSKLKL